MLAVACLATVYYVVELRPASQSGLQLRPDETTGLYLNGDRGTDFAGEIIAAKLDLFAEAGVRIRLETIPDDREFFASVVRDRAIGVTTGSKFLLARWRGEPVTAFGASFLDTAAIMVAPEKSGIRVPRDIVGRRLGYRRGAEELVIYDAMMAQLGLPRSQVTLVPVEDVFSALHRGQVDAGVTAIGKLPLLVEGNAVRFNVIKPQDYGIHVPGLVYIASSELLRDRPSVVREALRAMILGWQDVYVHPERAVAELVTADPTHLNAQQVRFSLTQQRDLVRPTGMRIADYDESRWNTLRDILLYAKLGEQTVPLSTAVTYSIVRDVYRRPLNPDGEGGVSPANEKP